MTRKMEMEQEEKVKLPIGHGARRREDRRVLAQSVSGTLLLVELIAT